jgi:tripeptidyl-peptidase-1
MPSFRSVLRVFSAAAFIQAAAASTFESLVQTPRGWTFVRKADSDESVKLRVSLKQQNVDSLYQKVMEVSTPDHAEYGKHYEGHELRSLLAPTQETSDTAIAWLQDNNITAVKDDSDYVLFSTSVELANKLLDAEFAWYTNENKQEVLRTLHYSVPSSVASHINFIQPTTRFGNLTPLGSTAEKIDTGAAFDGHTKWWGSPISTPVNITCNLTITPECLLDIYNVHYKGDPKNGNTVGFASFLEEYARYSDFQKFETTYLPYAVGTNVSTLLKLHLISHLQENSLQPSNSTGVLTTSRQPKIRVKPTSTLNIFLVLDSQPPLLNSVLEDVDYSSQMETPQPQPTTPTSLT